MASQFAYALKKNFFERPLDFASTALESGILRSIYNKLSLDNRNQNVMSY